MTTKLLNLLIVVITAQGYIMNIPALQIEAMTNCGETTLIYTSTEMIKVRARYEEVSTRFLEELLKVHLL